MPFRFDPEYWRERARQIRAQAKNMADKEARRIMLRVAEDYEKLGETAAETKRLRQDNSR